MEEYVFTASQDMETTNYELSISLPDDDVFEEDEGFILYFEFDENEINADDFSRLNTGTKTILVTISDNDACKNTHILVHNSHKMECRKILKTCFYSVSA